MSEGFKKSASVYVALLLALITDTPVYADLLSNPIRYLNQAAGHNVAHLGQPYFVRRLNLTSCSPGFCGNVDVVDHIYESADGARLSIIYLEESGISIGLIFDQFHSAVRRSINSFFPSPKRLKNGIGTFDSINDTFADAWEVRQNGRRAFFAAKVQSLESDRQYDALYGYKVYIDPNDRVVDSRTVYAWSLFSYPFCGGIGPISIMNEEEWNAYGRGVDANSTAILDGDTPPYKDPTSISDDVFEYTCASFA